MNTDIGLPHTWPVRSAVCTGVDSSGPRNRVLDQVHIDATWRIRLNDPRSARAAGGDAVLCQITLTTCFTFVQRGIITLLNNDLGALLC